MRDIEREGERERTVTINQTELVRLFLFKEVEVGGGKQAEERDELKEDHEKRKGRSRKVGR